MANKSLENRTWKGYAETQKKPVSPEYYNEFLGQIIKRNISSDISRDYEKKVAILTEYFPNIKLATETEQKLGAQFNHLIGSAKKYLELTKVIENAEKCIIAEKGLTENALYYAQERTAIVLSDLPLKALRVLSFRHGKEVMGGFYRK